MKQFSFQLDHQLQADAGSVVLGCDRSGKCRSRFIVANIFQSVCLVSNSVWIHRFLRANALASWAGLVLLISLTGCQWGRGFRDNAAPAPIVFNSVPAAEELIQRLNSQAARVQQLQSNISLEVAGTPRLTGNLVIERPNRLRLKAGVGGITELGFDLGSNSELFWIWNKASIPGQPPPAIYYAYQRDFATLQRQIALPIDPQWIIDATGLVEFLPEDIHQGPFVDPSGRLTLNTIRRTATGNVTRVAYVDPSSALIQQQAIYDSQNQLIAYTNATNFEYIAEHDVSLPRRVILHVVGSNGQTMQVTINASKFRVNSFYGDALQTWSMPRPDGVPLINLAEQDPTMLP